MLIPYLVICMCLMLETAWAGAPVRIVFIDNESEEALGKFPLDRRLIAEGLIKIHQSEAHGVVLKMFFDQPKAIESDELLGRAICRGNVVLQSRLDDSETNENILPARFFLDAKIETFANSISGRAAWNPLPEFSRCAKAVGFVDFNDLNRVPIFETYQSKPVKSLYFCALELAVGTSGVLTNHQVNFGRKSLKLEKDGQVLLPSNFLDEKFEYIPFHKILNGSANLNELKGAVVILGYDGTAIHAFDTPQGKIKAHRLFVLQLLALQKLLNSSN